MLVAKVGLTRLFRGIMTKMEEARAQAAIGIQRLTAVPEGCYVCLDPLTDPATWYLEANLYLNDSPGRINDLSCDRYSRTIPSRNQDVISARDLEHPPNRKARSAVGGI